MLTIVLKLSSEIIILKLRRDVAFGDDCFDFAPFFHQNLKRRPCIYGPSYSSVGFLNLGLHNVSLKYSRLFWSFKFLIHTYRNTITIITLKQPSSLYQLLKFQIVY